MSAGPVVSNSQPLSPGRTPGRAQLVAVLLSDTALFKPVKVAKYHKYSRDIQINVVKVSLPHTIF